MKYVTPDEAYDYFLRTLSNRNRIKILNELLEGPKNVGAITQKLGTSQSAVSNNLSRLKICGFVTVKPNGKERIYVLNTETIEPLMKLINKHVTTYCTECIKRDKKGTLQ